MRVSSHWLVTLGCLFVFAVAIVTSFQWITIYRGYDLRLRHNEICCAHEGINPFDVWARRVESAHFVGLWRPDFPEGDPGRLTVHAYPPWHTTFAWFYRWIPQESLVTWMSILNTLAFVLFGWTLRRWAPPEAGPARRDFFLLAFAGIAIPMAHLFGVGNYGGLLLAVLIGMVAAFERRHEGRLGLLWALAMVKPQVGLLLFWPLFFAKRYKAIAVAVGICLLATLWPAYVYRVSPLELLLQVPQMGTPYLVKGWSSPIEVIHLLLGTGGLMAWTILCFLVCAGLSWLTRRSESVLLRFAPVLIVFPLWTYSQSHDRVVLGLLYALILSAVYTPGVALLSRRARVWFMVALGCILVATGCSGALDVAYKYAWLDITRSVGFYRAFKLFPTYLPAALATWILLKSVRPLPSLSNLPPPGAISR